MVFSLHNYLITPTCFVETELEIGGDGEPSRTRAGPDLSLLGSFRARVGGFEEQVEGVRIPESVFLTRYHRERRKPKIGKIKSARECETDKICLLILAKQAT